MPEIMAREARPWLTPGALIAGVMFGIVGIGVLLLVGWFVYTAPVKVETHLREGQEYHCSYWRDGDITCRAMDDPDIGGGLNASSNNTTE